MQLAENKIYLGQRYWITIQTKMSKSRKRVMPIMGIELMFGHYNLKCNFKWCITYLFEVKKTIKIIGEQTFMHSAYTSNIPQ